MKLCDENVDFCKYTLFFCLLLSLLCYGEIDAKKAILLLSFSPKFDSFPCHGTKKGIILLTDSDGGGKQIRSFLSGLVEKDKLYHVYIPQIAGKESRKSSPSKAGFLGVEGVGREILEKAL